MGAGKSKIKQTKTNSLSSLNKSDLNMDTRNKESLYCKALCDLQFASFDMGPHYIQYHYHSSLFTKDRTPSGGKIKRLVEESKSLITDMPLSLEGSIFVRVDETRIDVIKALITGPSGTPYGFGCFEFDIWVPDNYPLSPPSVTLITTGNGTFRFNPNLYSSGYVCLSLLGTWEATHESETWQPNTSTILQVLVSIQSLILVDQPYFNEPGLQYYIGDPSQAAASLEYNRTVQYHTITLAMLTHLQHPSPPFAEVIKLHFQYTQSRILDQCEVCFCFYF